MELTFNKKVRVGEVDFDRYGRIVGRVYMDGLDVNAELVKQGYAWVYRKYAKDPELYRLEEEARHAKRGVWATQGPMPPWEWREGKRDDTDTDEGQIVANKRSKVYHLPECPGYSQVSEKSRVLFSDREAAESEGYQLAGNCE